ncbi:H(+)/Cl(-) exchange transporter ClcA [Cyanothece sp. BG0011]|uniref:H(+)/Cl(-) exchange transporter ClcA n=1 Tax=Cyanothece sp. BG0011 TaxID=2082950 RepID=UPI000D1FA667|nr:H(+)/Cl(-) exchange transporter ClcA [Cyanothece sp. BG0011]
MENREKISQVSSRLMPQALLEAKQKLKIKLLLWAALVGILTGGVGTLFQVAVSQVIQGRKYLLQLVKNDAVLNWLVPTVLSAIMVYLAFGLMRRLAPETGGSGIPQIEGFLDGLLPIRWQWVLPVKFLGGLLALGSGMVLGREGPTIQMGGSIGKMVGSYFRSSGEQIKILVAAGAGAGLASAFNAPLAGILFVNEEMRPNFKDRISSYRAVALASVMATIVVRVFLGQGADIKITKFEAPPLVSLLGFALLGICLGIIGYVFNLCLFRTLDWFSNQRGLSYLVTGLYVGAAIGFLSWLYPPIIGGGDETIFWAFRNEAPGYVLLSLFLLRFGLTMFCYGCGAPGGIFAPMLALATTFSMGATQQVHDWFEFPFLLPEPDAFAVAGMGALVAATVRAPLTAIVLTIEMTDNYLLILPLLVTCLTSTITAHALGGEPIYSVLLKRNLRRIQGEQSS